MLPFLTDITLFPFKKPWKSPIREFSNSVKYFMSGVFVVNIKVYDFLILKKKSILGQLYILKRGKMTTVIPSYRKIVVVQSIIMSDSATPQTV